MIGAIRSPKAAQPAVQEPHTTLKIVSPKEFRRLNPETVHAKNHVRFDAKAAGVDCSRSVHRLPALPATRSCCIPPATLAAR